MHLSPTLSLSLTRVPFDNMDGEGFMTHTAARQQTLQYLHKKDCAPQQSRSLATLIITISVLQARKLLLTSAHSQF